MDEATKCPGLPICEGGCQVCPASKKGTFDKVIVTTDGRDFKAEQVWGIAGEHRYLIMQKVTPIEELPPGITLHKLAEIIARNCVAWDNSKDKRTGLLPEVYLTDRGLYKMLTGEEYTQYGACRKFNIGE